MNNTSRSSVGMWHRFIFPILVFFRAKRGRFISGEFPDIAKYRICDLGGSRHYWDEIGLSIPTTNVTIFNISDCEVGGTADSDADQIKVCIYDGKRIPVEDEHFDLLVCNSVIEHVPLAARAELAREMCRVAKRIYCQTPSYWFPVEPHFVCPFLHWLPRPIGRLFAYATPWRLLSSASSEHVRTYFDEIALLTEGEVQALFPLASVYKERVAGLTKSYVAVWDRTR